MNNVEYDTDSESVSESQAPEPDKKHIILAVDDMPSLLVSVINMLQKRYTVMSATSGLAALKVIEEHTPSLFLLDIEMPQMDGYALASMIRARDKFANTPIVFLTAQGTRDDVVTAVSHGGTDYVLKPVGEEMLLDKIQRYLP